MPTQIYLAKSCGMLGEFGRDSDPRFVTGLKVPEKGRIDFGRPDNK